MKALEWRVYRGDVDALAARERRLQLGDALCVLQAQEDGGEELQELWVFGVNGVKAEGDDASSAISGGLFMLALCVFGDATCWT